MDFGYRAHLAGYRIARISRARGIHRDAAATNLAAAARRWYQAGRSASRLFEKYPELAHHLPMFSDKTAIVWARGPALLVARKLARRAASSQPALRALEGIAAVLERYYPSLILLRPLYRWVIGGYIYNGYRAGRRQLARPIG